MRGENTTSQEVPGEDALTNSPSDNGDVDLFTYVGAKSEHEAKAALWYGVAMGLLLVLGAYWAAGYVDKDIPFEDLPPTWYDWVWIIVAGLGIAGSFAIASHLLSVRKPGDRQYYALAALGGAVSLAMVTVLAFDSSVAIRSLFSLSETPLWPDTKPLWFLPLSVLGVSLPLVSLLIVRGGDVRERALGIVLACIPLFILSLPLLLDFDAAELIRWAPSIYAAAGIPLMFSGMRPILRLTDVSLDSLEYVSSRAFILVLVAAGLIGWWSAPSGEVLSSSWDLVWLLPLLASLVVSVMLLAVARDAPGRRYDLRPELMGYTGLVWSLVLVVMFVLGFMDVGGLGEVRTIWLYPISLVGITTVMVGVNLLGKGTWTDRTVGVTCALVPLLVTGIIAVVAGLAGSVEEAGPAPSTLSAPLLSGAMAIWTYLALAVAVLVSGLRIETFWKMQLPILREKSSLSRKRTLHILRQVLRNPMGVIGVIILAVFAVIAAIGPSIAPYEVDPLVNGEFTPYEGQSSEHWMGVDNVGRDVFSELLYGARTSIIVGIVAAAISSILGALLGLYSGYVGGWKDEVIMRLNDIVLSIPWLVLMIIIAAFMGSIDLMGIILVIGLTGWSGTARLVRAQVLSLRERQYIERAKAIGSDDMHIISKHILPNAFPLVFANTILTVAISILSEATLSFLGLRPQGTVTWGTMLSYAQAANAFSLGLHWWIVAPGLCIVLVVLGFTLLGYALDDVMNPKLRKR